MRARWILAVAAASLLVMAVAGLVLTRRPAEPVTASLAVVDDDDRFATALEASDAFAEISGLLGGVDCDAQRDDTCVRAHRASAWAQVTAVLIARCAPAAVFEARAGLGQYLRGRGELPSTPRCGARRQDSS